MPEYHAMHVRELVREAQSGRVSARELLYELEREKGALGARGGAQARGKSTVMDRLPENVRQSLERMRRGERTEESKQ